MKASGEGFPLYRAAYCIHTRGSWEATTRWPVVAYPTVAKSSSGTNNPSCSSVER